MPEQHTREIADAGAAVVVNAHGTRSMIALPANRIVPAVTTRYLLRQYVRIQPRRYPLSTMPPEDFLMEGEPPLVTPRQEPNLLTKLTALGGYTAGDTPEYLLRPPCSRIGRPCSVPVPSMGFHF